MSRIAALLVLTALLITSVGVSQEKANPKKDEPAKKDEKKDEPMTKAKGMLPANWGKLGLTEDQKQKVYRVQNKYNEEIDLLELKIKELKEKMAKERFEVLTPEQKKRLRDLAEGKSGSTD
jgi:Spy/CpxP family protein refolding chaperone